MDTVSTILISTVVAIAAVFIGAKVQRTAKFIYPHDFLTIGIAMICIADIVAGSIMDTTTASGLDPYWYLPFSIGYVAGYLVVGRTKYVMVWETYLGGKHIAMSPWVIWTEHGSTYLQEQNNRALFRRLFCRVKHEVVANAPIDDDWSADLSFPLLPAQHCRVLCAESVAVTWSPVRIGLIYVRQYVTELTLAYAGTASKMQLAQDEAALEDMQTQNVDLISEIHDLRKQQGPALLEMALRLDQSVEASSPANRMYSLIRNMKKRKTEGDDNGNPGKDENAD